MKEVLLNVRTCNGVIMILTEKEIERIEVFRDMVEYTINSQPIDVDFPDNVIRNYLKWSLNNETVMQLEWSDLIDLFIFADFAGCEEYKTYFVKNMVSIVFIEEESVLTIRYLLSLSRDRKYLYAAYDDKNILYDPLEEFDNEDYLLTHIKVDDLEELFNILPLYKQAKLKESFPRNHRFRDHVFKMIFYCREKYDQ